MKKVLILYTSVGLGHKSIAENIGTQLEANGFTVKSDDIGSVQKGMFEKSVTTIHSFINNRLPFVWGWLYDYGHFLILPFRVFIAGFNHKLTQSYVEEFKPDIIITTQTTASAVIAYLKKRNLYKGLFGIAFSDFHLHRYWLYPQADFYLANIAEQKVQMVKLGVPENKIFVCGMTLKPEVEIDISSIKNKLSVGPRDKVILIGSGSLGTGVDENLVAQFANQPNIKVFAVCGKNEIIYRQLKSKLASAGNVTVLGFYPAMDELYAIADVFITKPGGLSVSEALRWNLPMIISHLLPGQEQYNFDYLLHNHLVMPKYGKIAEQAIDEVRSGSFRAALKSNPKLDVLFPKDAAALAVGRLV
ncbi:MAG: glycosyltransferase [Candidatus Doudnabacteria bacterium]|nr:glycosyltransferase [Candidatus Doudnabacteria bacterium]